MLNLPKLDKGGSNPPQTDKRIRQLTVECRTHLTIRQARG